MAEEGFWEEKGVTRSLPYGIKDVKVHYVCAYCGEVVEAEKLASLPSLMCPKCGQRIFVKTRAPPQTGFIRKVRAV